MKRWIKIIILFILVVIILIGGWNMYKGLEHNKEAFSANIYSYISPQATKVININKEYNIDNLLIYDSSLANIVQLLKNVIPYPAIICYFKGDKKVFLAKATSEQEINMGVKMKNPKRRIL